MRSTQDFIYNGGDTPGLSKWTSNYYLAWIAGLLALKFAPAST